MSDKTSNKSKNAKPVVEEAPVEVVAEVVVEEAPEPAAVEPVAEAPAVEPDPTWDVQTWSEVILQRLGHNSHVLAGALHGQDLTREYSEKEICSLVEKYLSTPA